MRIIITLLPHLTNFIGGQTRGKTHQRSYRIRSIVLGGLSDHSQTLALMQKASIEDTPEPGDFFLETRRVYPGICVTAKEHPEHPWQHSKSDPQTASVAY